MVTCKGNVASEKMNMVEDENEYRATRVAHGRVGLCPTQQGATPTESVGEDEEYEHWGVHLVRAYINIDHS